MFWGKGMVKILGINIIQKNERTGPMGDMIIANHLGFHEIPVLLSFYPATFAIKDGAKNVFVTGKALTRTGNIFINMENPMLRTQALFKLIRLLKRGGRIILFPEGKFTPGSKRQPFNSGSFFAVKRLDKTVEACVIDSPSEREALVWSVNKKILPQLLDLFGRKKIDISIEFFKPVKVKEEPAVFAKKWQNIIQKKLEENEKESFSRDTGLENVG